MTTDEDEQNFVPPEFMMAVKMGVNYHFCFIKIDHDRVGKENDFYFDVIRSSFPRIENINVMLTKYREQSDKTLYSASTSEDLQAIFEKRKDLLFGMVYEGSWKYLVRADEVKK